MGQALKLGAEASKAEEMGKSAAEVEAIRKGKGIDFQESFAAKSGRQVKDLALKAEDKLNQQLRSLFSEDIASAYQSTVMSPGYSQALTMSDIYYNKLNNLKRK